MPTHRTAVPALHATLPLALATALACSQGGPAPITCDTTESCPPAARCLAFACVADAAPLARISPLSAVQANDVVTLDGSRSSDPDAPEDAVVAYAWTVRAVDAPCEPPVVAGTTATTPVRFACPGRYEISLVVADELSVQSAPASALVEVAPRSGAPLVTAGADVAVDHRCEGEPITCRPVTELGGAVALSATSAVAGASFHWTVEPPAGHALDAQRRAIFEPGPDAPSPTVRIETDGTAISGDWVLRVEARDEAGVIGVAATRLSIGNAPPVVTEAIPVFNHAFDAASSRFSAHGAIGVVAEDPDGDPLEGRTVAGHHVGDGAATFQVEDLGDRAAFSIELPYTAPADALLLIGGEGLERAITYSVRDVNGAETSETWPVVIGNRPPEVAWAATVVSPQHVYDAAAGEYRASAKLSQWRDPDGDPMAQGDPTGDAVCPSYVLDASGMVVIQCTLASAVAAVAGNFVGAHDIQQRVRDPWESAPVASVAQIQIQNRAPVFTKNAFGLGAQCVETATCCRWEYGQCLVNELAVSSASGTVTDFVTDPDGDPVEWTVSQTGQTQVCLASQCALEVSFAADRTCSESTSRTYTMSATDGAASTPATFVVTRSCAW
ncbi:PKD domain-containing protein [Anaeromyxobacter soli]|uniref:PKD domain-containing protein n=1 Tax=Anaeromyxobacter soli TaxID=2922725 RepID=UPI001FAF23D9|nr:PKD domain-containing protein [Anaeromyxobacter sp. SG29]